MIVLVAGASGGFGNVLAEYLASRGMTVYGTSRSGDGPRAITTLPMNVRDDASVKTCIDDIVRREGRIDVVVNCINEMIIGGMEEQTADEVAAIYDTNVFGALRLWHAVLPHMKKQGSGTIVTMSSLGGILAVPYMSAYTSAKFALEAMTEALYHEVRGDGIDVVIMQPVAMHMDRPATGNHLHTAECASDGSPTFNMVNKMAKDTAASKLTPEMVAKRVHQIILQKKKPLRVPMDKAKPIGMVKRLAPQGLINRLIDGLLSEIAPRGST